MRVQQEIIEFNQYVPQIGWNGHFDVLQDDEAICVMVHGDCFHLDELLHQFSRKQWIALCLQVNTREWINSLDNSYLLL
jgi:hypothetical protein